MKQKIAVVSSTPRKNGNSEVLAEEFTRGAREAGHEVTRIDLRNMELKFCIGCMACHDRGACVLGDGMNALYPLIGSMDVLVFATPVYYYGMSGQLKTFLDRLNPLYGRGNAFRRVYLLATAADGDESAVDGTITGMEGWISCFDGVTLSGVVKGVGAEKVGDVLRTDAPRQAYLLGKNLE